MMIVALLLAGTADCGSLTSQTAMNTCQQAAADRADAEMNVQWRRTKAAMDVADRERGEGGHATALLTSQRAWLAFREAECRIESYEWRGGSMQAFTENQCRVQVTGARTRQLREMASWGAE